MERCLVTHVGVDAENALMLKILKGVNTITLKSVVVSTKEMVHE